MIGQNIVPNNVIAKGTYQFYKDKRITGTWKNAAQIEKQDVYSLRKTVIQFSIIPMNLTDHEAIKWLFASQENLLVSYWDDYDCEYKTGDVVKSSFSSAPSNVVLKCFMEKG